MQFIRTLEINPIEPQNKQVLWISDLKNPVPKIYNNGTWQKLKDPKDPYINNLYCEIINDTLYLRGDYQILLDAGYVPYLYRKATTKRRPKSRIDENVSGISKVYKRWNRFGTINTIKIESNGQIKINEMTFSMIGSFHCMTNTTCPYNGSPQKFVSPLVKDIHSIPRITWGKKAIRLDDYKKTEETYYPYKERLIRLQYAIGFAKPITNARETILLSDLKSNLATFSIEVKGIGLATQGEDIIAHFTKNI